MLNTPGVCFESMSSVRLDAVKESAVVCIDTTTSADDDDCNVDPIVGFDWCSVVCFDVDEGTDLVCSVDGSFDVSALSDKVVYCGI